MAEPKEGTSNDPAHLSKSPSDLKQNGTQEKAPFSGAVFHAFSGGVDCFALTVSFWNHQNRSFPLADGRDITNQKVVYGANTRNKTDHTTCKGTKCYARK